MRIVLINTLYVDENKLIELNYQLISLGHQFIYYLKKPTSDEDFIDRVKDADVLIIDNTKLNSDILMHCKKLKYIDIAFTGIDHIDIDYCKKHNIHVSNASGYSTNAVAELTIGLILSSFRKIELFNKLTRNHKDKSNILGLELNNKTVGIIGFGKIGREVAKLLHSFDCKLIAYSHNKILELPNYVKQTTLEELLNDSDVVSLHCLLTSETKGLISYDEFKAMKKHPLIINTARGPIINHDALINALENNLISGACLDVYDYEPPIDEDALFHFENIICLPHVGYFTKEAMDKRLNIVKENLFAYLKDGSILNKIN